MYWSIENVLFSMNLTPATFSVELAEYSNSAMFLGHKTILVI